jgi:hypothetical protein
MISGDYGVNDIGAQYKDEQSDLRSSEPGELL